MVLNDPGLMVETIWDELSNRFPHLELDACVVMPNHIHGILVLDSRRGEPCVRPENCVLPEPCVRPDFPDGPKSGDKGCKTGANNTQMGEHRMGEHKVRPYGTLPDTVGRVVQAFKSITTHEYARGVKQFGWPRFEGKLWQRNYYEHIIRNDGELNSIRKYITENPAQWALDRENRRSKE
jgi:REP element-mobilizing transposase RayT